ncbi:bestrophin-like domain [Streptomyces mayteni]
MSEWLALVLIILATCGAVFLFAVIRQRRAGTTDDPSQTPDVIEYMTMMLGVVYAIVLGLAIAGVWEARGSAEDWVRQEAQALHEMDQRAGVFPPEVRDEIRADITGYVDYVLEDEWPLLVDHGELGAEGDVLLREMRELITGREPTTVRETESYQGMIDQLARVDEARVGRAQSAEPTMPLAVWIGLISGAVAVIGMVFVLQIRRSGRELLLAGMFTAMIAFLLFLVYHFDAPYSRGLNDVTESYTRHFPEAGGAS